MKTENLVKTQVIVAAIAIAVTAFSFYQLVPLTEKLTKLKAEISALEAKRNELQRNNDAITKTAKPIENPSGNVAAWLYVGRISSGDQWAPPSEGVAPFPDASVVRNIKNVSVKKNSRFVENIESSSESTTSQPSEAPVQLVRAGTELPVLDLKTQPSVGGGSLVWVKVNIPANTILEIPGK